MPRRITVSILRERLRYRQAGRGYHNPLVKVTLERIVAGRHPFALTWAYLSAKDPLPPNLEGHNVKIGSRKGFVCLVMLRSKNAASMFLALRLRNRWVFTWSVHIGQAIVKL